MKALAADGRRKGSGNGMYGRTHTSKSREKMSETRTANIIAGVYDPSRWSKKGEKFASKAGRLIPYRSLWELRAIEMLESDDTVTCFKFEPFRVVYYYNNNRRHYVPDFLVTYSDGRRLLIEVKPLCFVDAAINIAKFAAAREYCSMNGLTFEVWTQEKLGEVLRE